MSTIDPNMEVSPTKESFETYIETWNPTTMAAIDALANKSSPPSLAGVTIDIAFATFGKTPPATTLSVVNFSERQVKELVDKVHSYGGEVKISFGGASQTDPAGYQMWLSDFLKSPSDVSILANSIVNFIKQNGFDGIDFDIEDRGVSADFPDLAAALIKEVRQQLPNAEITLTVPGQPWGQYWVPLIQKAVGDVDHINFMEYDIWIDKSGEGTDGTPKTYATQIQWDINYYISNFGIPPNKIELGLMPGNDDIGNNLTLKDAIDLAKYAQSIGLAGVMTWDLNRDYVGQDGMASGAYSSGVREILSAQSSDDRYNVEQSVRGMRGPKLYRAEAPEDKDLNTDKLPEPKPAGLFDLASSKKKPSQ